MILLNRIFGEPEEINGGERCPTCLWRWTIAKWRGRGIYLHHFVADDWSLDLHDHPKRFISVGLKGRYVEITPDHGNEVRQTKTRTLTAPWIRSFPATHVHRIRMVRGWMGQIEDCWTLVIVLKPVRSWGFWHLGKFIPWREYVGSETATEMKACE